jgi:hypothetical protein
VTDPVADVVEAMWQRNRARLLARLDRVEAALRAQSPAAPVDTAAAEDAHVLAGALGTYGRPGSELLKQVELALARRSEHDPIPLAEQVRRLADTL